MQYCHNIPPRGQLSCELHELCIGVEGSANVLVIVLSFETGDYEGCASFEICRNSEEDAVFFVDIEN